MSFIYAPIILPYNNLECWFHPIIRYLRLQSFIFHSSFISFLFREPLEPQVMAQQPVLNVRSSSSYFPPFFFFFLKTMNNQGVKEELGQPLQRTAGLAKVDISSNANQIKSVLIIFIY